MIGTDHLPQVFGIHTGSHRRGVDKIAEHDGELSALRRALRGLRHGRRLAAMLADRALHLQPVSERDTELLQMLVGQLRQDIRIDAVLAKHAFILAKAERTQPFGDIHVAILRAAWTARER